MRRQPHGKFLFLLYCCKYFRKQSNGSPIKYKPDTHVFGAKKIIMVKNFHYEKKFTQQNEIGT